jgi:hypothetical protein
LAKDKPQLLVAVARIFNNEEATYRELQAKKKALIDEFASNQTFDRDALKDMAKDDDDFTST